MKIVDSEAWETTFEDIPLGGVFIHSDTVYMKTVLSSEEHGVSMQTGIMYNFFPLEKVLPLPNAELHLNK